MNKSKHLSVDFCSEERAPDLVNDPRFMSLEEYDGCYEVNIQTKQKIDVYGDFFEHIGCL